MGKRNSKAKQATTTTTPPAGAAGTTPQAAKVLHLRVKQGVAYRGARAAWYAVLVQYDGKPASDYLAACKANPPSLPKSGVPEAPQGWLGYFVRTGVAALVPG